MRVVVAGGGIGGMAAALALARRGAAVEVFERAPGFGEVGAGLQLSPNATRILFAWGLETALRATAFEPRSADILDAASGRLLMRTPLGEAAERRWRAPYLQMHRADLHAVLACAAGAAGVVLRPGCAVDGFEDEGQSVRVHAGRDVHVADVLVGADGIHSAVRARLIGETSARFTGQVAWRGLVAADRLPSGLIAPGAVVWTAPGRHFVHYFVRGGELVNFVGFTPERRWIEESWTARAAPGEIASAFAGWPEPVRTLVDAAEAQGGGGRWAVHDRAPVRRWSRGRVGLLGDAAHPMAPFLAQGAAMAVEDAEALARHLAAGGDADRALAAYARERGPRTARVQAWATRNGSVFHLPGPLRRAAFAAARILPGQGPSALDWLYGYDVPDAV